MFFNFRYRIFVATLAVAFLFLGGIAFADHAWSNYHWARTANPFALKLGDNVTSAWDSYLVTASGDWNQSSVLDTAIVAGGTRAKNCRPTAGRVEVCNASYGNNGWLGIASIWVSGGHITQGITKLNDYYFSKPTYNTQGWKSLVACQEIGHTFGLTHQDEDFDNAPITPHTCMDYFVPSTNEIVHPNQHDYDELETIYGHLDSSTTAGQTLPRGNGVVVEDLEDPREWGRILERDAQGKPSLFERDFGRGHRVITHVFWADAE